MDAYQILQSAVSTVLERFKAAEALGYRSRERQYAIDVLGTALTHAEQAADAEHYAALERKEMAEPRGTDEE